MNDLVRTLDIRPHLDRETGAVAGGDVIVLTILVVIGQIDHRILESPLATLETLLPFVVGWFVVGVLAGVFTAGVRRSPARAARVTTVTWLAAANVGLILRSSTLFDGGGGWPFNLVLTGFGLLFLLVWRVSFAMIVTTRTR